MGRLHARCDHLHLSVWQDKSGWWHGSVQREDARIMKMLGKLSRSPGEEMDIEEMKRDLYTMARIFSSDPQALSLTDWTATAA